MTRPGSGQDVDDYSGICEGDIDPFLNKKVRTLVLKTQEFVVYLDDELFVEWGITDSLSRRWKSEWDSVLNEVSALEAEPIEGLNEIQVESFRRMLAESVARILDTGNISEAQAMFERARGWLRARCVDSGRRWYLCAALVAAAIVSLAGLVFWVSRDRLSVALGSGAVRAAVGASAGGVGALASVALGVAARPVDSRIGRALHLLDGGLRIVSGCLGAFFVALAINARMFIAPLIDTSNQTSAILLFGFVAGMSERFVPNLVRRFEETTTNGSGSQLDKK